MGTAGEHSLAFWAFRAQGTHPKQRNTHLDLEIETSVVSPQANKGIPSGPILSSTERGRRRKTPQLPAVVIQTQRQVVLSEPKKLNEKSL
jgi:hypothetical protein